MRIQSFATLLMLMLSAPSMAMEVCSVKMDNAALYELAQKRPTPIKDLLRVRHEGGSWTEMTANNRGSSEIAVARGNKVSYFQVFAKQIGTTSDCEILRVEELDPSTINPLAKQAERYKLAIRDVLYYSEAEYPWEPFYSELTVAQGLPEKDLREALRVYDPEVPVEVTSSEETLEILNHWTEAEGQGASEEYFRYGLLKWAMLKDFAEVQMIRVGVPDSGAIDVYLVGRTKEGKLVGLKTVSVET